MPVQFVLGFFDLLKGIAWPIAVIAIATAYKPEILANIGSFFRRKLRLSLPGIGEIEAGAAEEQQKTSNTEKAVLDPSAVKLEEIEGLPPRTKAVEAVERRLHVMVPNVTGKPVDVLIRNLAQARLDADFGITYAKIFGTQIAALVILDARRKLTNKEAFEFYQEAVERPYGDFYKDYGYSGWLNFMIERGLVRRSNNEEIEISDIGIDFLGWLKAQQLPAGKLW